MKQRSRAEIEMQVLLNARRAQPSILNLWGRISRTEQRLIRRRLWQVLGLILMSHGYSWLSVEPQASADETLRHLAIGFVLLFAGFACAILPLLSHLHRDMD